MQVKIISYKIQVWQRQNVLFFKSKIKKSQSNIIH